MHTERNNKALSVVSMHNSGLTTEQTAAAFARFSRSPDTVAENAAETLKADTARFHNKWTLDYGHSSIAEHAPVQLAVEDISRVVCDLLESGRLASYTEKSSRFQNFNTDQFAVPPELNGNPALRDTYIDACRSLIETALDAQEVIAEYLARTDPDAPNQARSAKDAARGILPAGALTSLGLTLNARSLAHAVSKLLSHPLQEANQLGDALKDAAAQQLPTLLKRANSNPHLTPSPQSPNHIDAGSYRPPQILNHNPGAERIICAAIHYSMGMDFDQAESAAQTLSSEERNAMLLAHTSATGPHDRLPREFELPSCRIALTVDYGSLRQLNRHRLQTNLNQPLQPHLGPNVPDLAIQAGAAHFFQEAHQRSWELHDLLSQHTNHLVAQYAVLHCHWQRTQINANLRQLHNLLRLRTRPNVHPALRREMLLTLALSHETHPAIFPESFD